MPHLIELHEARGLEISWLHLMNSPLWTVHPFACVGVFVHDVEIRNPVWAANTDGVNPDSSEDVLIENMIYTGGDDAIAIKSGWDCFGDEHGFNRPTRNVTIRNLTVLETRAAAVAIGSEMSGGVEYVLIEISVWRRLAWEERWESRRLQIEVATSATYVQRVCGSVGSVDRLGAGAIMVLYSLLASLAVGGQNEIQLAGNGQGLFQRFVAFT